MEMICRLDEIGPVFPQFKDRIIDHIQENEVTHHTEANVNKAAGQNCPAAFRLIQNPNSMQ